jgi:molecular chaperone GrpE
MSEERQDAPATGAEAQVKVTDRRRFTPEGEPVAQADAASQGGDGGPAGDPPALPPADERDEQLAAQAARIDELLRAYAALVEDNKAFRQRTEREKARVIEAERAGIAQALLEAADDLERALSAVGPSPSAAVKTLAEGVQLSLAALQKRIGELGAERLVVTGLPYDPQLAEAVDMVPVTDAAQDGSVVQEVRAGYRIKDRVLRPARVRVGRLAQA